MTLNDTQFPGKKNLLINQRAQIAPHMLLIVQDLDKKFTFIEFYRKSEVLVPGCGNLQPRKNKEVM